MAKNQSRTPGRDVRGGSGKGSKGYSASSGKKGSYGGSGSGRGGSGHGSYGRSGRGSGRGGSPKGGEKPRSSRRDGAARSDLIEGRRAVEEALAVGMPLKSALVAEGGELDLSLERLAERLEQAGVPVERVSRARLDALSSHGAHQGIVVRTKPFEYADLSQVIERAGDGDALVVVLDHVTDEGNFGAIVRTAEVVGAAGVVIPKARAAGVGVGSYKTSAGAVLHLPIAQVPNLARALDDLKEAGFWACAATEHAEQDVWHAPMGGRLALVMGSEGEGISRLVLEKCDFSCRLPQRGQVESLNVAQATTVMCYEWLRRVSERGDAVGEGAGSGGPVDG